MFRMVQLGNPFLGTPVIAAFGHLRVHGNCFRSQGKEGLVFEHASKGDGQKDSAL